MSVTPAQQTDAATVTGFLLVHRGPSAHQLPADPRAPGAARRYTHKTLQDWGLPAAIDAATLAVSELVTNAVRATAELGHDAAMAEPQTVALRLSCVGTNLIIEVWDRNTRPPVRQPHSKDDENGRGLEIVKSLSTRWSYYRPRAAVGKVTWCQIELPSAPERPTLEPSEPDPPLPRRTPSSTPLFPLEFNDDLDVLQRVADALRALDWELPSR